MICNDAYLYSMYCLSQLLLRIYFFLSPEETDSLVPIKRDLKQ